MMPFTIREGGHQTRYHSELDTLRDIKNNSKRYLQQLEEREKEKTGISTLKISYTNVFDILLKLLKKYSSSAGNLYQKTTTALLNAILLKN